MRLINNKFQYIKHDDEKKSIAANLSQNIQCAFILLEGAVHCADERGAIV